MLDGFNEGWIEFEGDSIKSEVALETVLRALIEEDGKKLTRTNHANAEAPSSLQANYLALLLRVTPGQKRPKTNRCGCSNAYIQFRSFAHLLAWAF
jgi:hypothetical protein